MYMLVNDICHISGIHGSAVGQLIANEVIF
jgi:hypothetical protein